MWSRWSAGGVSLALFCLFLLDPRLPPNQEWTRPGLFIPPPVGYPLTTVSNRNRRWGRVLGPFLKLMNETGLPVFLTSGTLLGWARGEEFIGDTTDIDLAARIQDFRPEWLHLMANLSQPRLKHFLGDDMNTSMELSFMAGSLKIDLFFAYPHSSDSNAFYMPGVYYPNNSLLFWDFNLSSPLRLCHSLLRELRVNVPCQWEEMLASEYGPDWRVPVPNANWSWYSSAANVRMGPRGKDNLWKTYPNTVSSYSRQAKAPNRKRDRWLVSRYIANFLS